MPPSYEPPARGRSEGKVASARMAHGSPVPATRQDARYPSPARSPLTPPSPGPASPRPASPGPPSPGPASPGPPRKTRSGLATAAIAATAVLGTGTLLALQVLHRTVIRSRRPGLGQVPAVPAIGPMGAPAAGMGGDTGSQRPRGGTGHLARISPLLRRQQLRRLPERRRAQGRTVGEKRPGIRRTSRGRFRHRSGGHDVLLLHQPLCWQSAEWHDGLVPRRTGQIRHRRRRGG